MLQWPSCDTMWPSMAKATVGIRETQGQASAIIDRVEEGEAITVTKHGRPVARIVSAATPAPSRRPGGRRNRASERGTPLPAGSPPSSEVRGKALRTTSLRVGAEPLPRYQRPGQAAGRRARNRGGPAAPTRCRRRPNHRDRPRRGNRGPCPNAQGRPSTPAQLRRGSMIWRTSGAGSLVHAVSERFWRRRPRAPAPIRFAPTTPSTSLARSPSPPAKSSSSPAGTRSCGRPPTTTASGWFRGNYDRKCARRESNSRPPA